MEIEGPSQDSPEERYLFDLIQNNIKNKIVNKLLERKPDLLEKIHKIIILAYSYRPEADKEDGRKDINDVIIILFFHKKS